MLQNLLQILILMLLLRLDDTVLFNFPKHDKLETMDFGSSIVFATLGGGGGYAWMIGAALGAIIHLAISQKR